MKRIGEELKRTVMDIVVNQPLVPWDRKLLMTIHSMPSQVIANGSLYEFYQSFRGDLEYRLTTPIDENILTIPRAQGEDNHTDPDQQRIYDALANTKTQSEPKPNLGDGEFIHVKIIGKHSPKGNQLSFKSFEANFSKAHQRINPRKEDHSRGNRYNLPGYLIGETLKTLGLRINYRKLIEATKLRIGELSEYELKIVENAARLLIKGQLTEKALAGPDFKTYEVAKLFGKLFEGPNGKYPSTKNTYNKPQQFFSETIITILLCWEEEDLKDIVYEKPN